MPHSVPPPRGVPPNNPYDPRDLQYKALQRWDRQQRVWATVEETIRRRVPINGKGPNIGGRNMEYAMYKKRIDVENQILLDNMAPPIELAGPRGWESKLRVSPKDVPTTYIPVGKREYPYPLHCKMVDGNRNHENNLVNTRVVHPKEKELNVGTTTGNRQSWAGPTGKGIPIQFQGKEYHSKQVARNREEIERHMPHFIAPRAYLELCGKQPPWTDDAESAAAAARRVPPVVHYPPVADPPPEEACLNSPQQSDKTKISPVEESDVCTDVAEEEAGGPCLVISTDRILFFTEPGKLAHGAVKIRNVGTTTVYYTWAPFQPTTELDGVIGQGNSDQEKEKCGSNQGDDSNHAVVPEKELNETRSSGSGPGSAKDSRIKATAQERTDKACVYDDVPPGQPARDKTSVSLRALATKSRESKAFFYLSNPLDGVVLPDDEVIFSFSVRAAYPGCFTAHYELLMVPAMATPLIVELCAFVDSVTPVASVLSDPVENVMAAKEKVDMQRRTVNALVSKESVFDASEIAKATRNCIALTKAPEEAREAEVSRWRLMWNDTTYMALRLPFNQDVYKRLDALYNNLKKVVSKGMDQQGMDGWNGSAQLLQIKISALRDAPARNTLREAFNILLRAAAVCEQENEPLELLLRRAAGMVAFKALAHRAAQLDDTISYALEIRTRPQILSNNPPGPVAAATRQTNQHAGSTGVRTSRTSSLKPRFGSAPQESYTVIPAPAEDQTNDLECAVAQETTIEKPLREEYNARLFTGMWRIVGDAVEQLCSMLETSRRTIEAACDLPLMEITMQRRADDVAIIQNTEDIDVDTALDAVAPKKRK
uniref:MYCBP-associated protein n=1 Tax=Trypanosoma congolense (strain IL3000) TaxID=1068625 RepID=G0URL3_TRYCI|nr:conserved hypothetical protein [Trypanosoma congolense IL3000]